MAADITATVFALEVENFMARGLDSHLIIHITSAPAGFGKLDKFVLGLATMSLRSRFTPYARFYHSAPT